MKEIEIPTKQLILRLPPETHKKLKMLSVIEEKTMTELIVLWVNEKTKSLKHEKN